MHNWFWAHIDLKDDEHILETADTLGILARKCGVKEASIRQMMSRARREGWRCSYIKIMEDEE